ncbi:autotransporter outer membrane beta-barrel domain-containing protein [Paraburkholderia hiiakae]|uniref:autotransporter outer membrane beta-barrel domain-containing protein n=1 Tax=Paraburkholderia hiiakae TaxID=1081782 RepID=UPI0038B289F3
MGDEQSRRSRARAATAPTFDALSIVNAHANTLRLAQADCATDLATGDSYSQVNVWGQAFGGHASQDARDNVDGYSANYGGLLIGADKALDDRWRVGGVFQYAHTAINNSDNTSGDSTGVNGYGLIGYASFTGSPWYVNLSGSAATFQYYPLADLATVGVCFMLGGQAEPDESPPRI